MKGDGSGSCRIGFRRLGRGEAGHILVILVILLLGDHAAFQHFLQQQLLRAFFRDSFVRQGRGGFFRRRGVRLRSLRLHMGQDRVGNFLGDDAVGYQLGQPLLKLFGPGCSISAAESFPADLTGQMLLVVLVRNLLLAILAALIRHLRGLGILSALVWHLGHLTVPVILSGHLSFSASSAPGGLHSCGCGLVHGIEEFNAKTAKDSGLVIPVIITVYQDRSFSLQFKSPPASTLLKKEAGLAKGSGVPNKNKVGKVTKAQLLKIVEMKKADLNTDDPEQAVKMIAGTARNMGIEVVE